MSDRLTQARLKNTCPTCKGRGYFVDRSHGHDDLDFICCDVCHGSTVDPNLTRFIPREATHAH